MKKFVKYIIFFLIAIAAIDLCAGVLLDYLNENSKGSSIQRIHHVATESNEDIVMFGSSRMSHHYIPQIFKDSLNATCFNAGKDGNGIIYAFAQLKMMLKHHTPKLIIYDVNRFDIYEDDNITHIAPLRPYCDDPDVMDIISRVDKSERLKLCSNLYRHNSTGLKTIGSYFVADNPENLGYVPLNGTMNYNPQKQTAPKGKIDSLKLEFVESFVKDCKERDIALLFAISPNYESNLLEEPFPEIQDICKKYNVAFLDYSITPGISDNKELFEDPTHLNHKGATIYTNHIINHIITNNLLQKMSTQ